MTRRSVASIVGAIALVAAAGPPLTRPWRLESARVAAGDVQLRIDALPGVRLRLLRAGPTLEAARPIPIPAADAWLPPANYFVEAQGGPLPLFFPVSLTGVSRGPDAGGSYAITIRASAEVPPAAADAAPFALIPAGQALLGDRRNPGEAHYVWTPAFHLATLEATNGAFRRFLAAADGYSDARNWTVDGWRWRSAAESRATAWMQPSDAGFDRFGADDVPVSLVTWFEAQAYCRWLTRTFGGGRWLFRLPAEAEWEKAARGPDAFEYGLGAELSEREAPLYNWRKNPDAEVAAIGLARSRGTYRPNRYGVFHASGNMAEWTQSVFVPYNADRPYRDDARNADETPGMRVSRGGSWYSANVVRLHLAYRDEFQPNLSSDDLGFRVAALRLPVR